MEHRRKKDLSTSRKNYFYDILMSFKEDIRKPIIKRLFEVASEMKQIAEKPEDTELIATTSEDRIVADLHAEAAVHSVVGEETIADIQKVSTETINNPVVFISYSWDDPDHIQWILNLSKKLFENGVQVILDRYELKPGANMIHFMETSISKANKVLVIFTSNYKAKAEKRQGGVGFEYSILNAELYQRITTNEKFIPILKAGEFLDSIPSFMQQFIAIDMRHATTFEDKFNELLLAIYDKPQLEKPLLGTNPFAKKIFTGNNFQNENNPDTNIKALKEIKNKTNFLWKGFVELDNFQDTVTEEIKDSTFQNTINSIKILHLNGLLSYKLDFAYEMTTTKEKVYILKVTNIAAQLKNWVRLIEDGQI